jgi:hypothetical protein
MVAASQAGTALEKAKRSHLWPSDDAIAVAVAERAPTTTENESESDRRSRQSLLLVLLVPPDALIAGRPLPAAKGGGCMIVVVLR